MQNPILLTDSYKIGHWNQYPKHMSGMQSYLESRGGEYERIVFFGLQYYLLKYLREIPTAWDINEAEQLANAHGEPFNRAGWERLVRLGYWPVKIYAVPEGTIHSPGTVLMTIESTDPETAWVVNYLETLLMKIWYGCTVATKSRSVKEMIESYYVQAGISDVSFAYHNFGDRGSSSVETAAIGGMAHLTQFKGTDNFNCLKEVQEYYGTSDCVGYSIPATEHSTVTSWGKDNEHKMIESYIDSYKNSPHKLIACVLDSYDLMAAVDFCCSLRGKIESDDYPTLVMRPDSGDPLEIIPQMLVQMSTSNLNHKIVNGYKLFDKYRIIWGDGITPKTISNILKVVMNLGYSPANFAFGSGGDIMQNINRDTCRFAIKCCAIAIKDGMAGADWFPVYKNPKTDVQKASKKGYQFMPPAFLRYINGAYHNLITFDQVRANSL